MPEESKQNNLQHPVIIGDNNVLEAALKKSWLTLRYVVYTINNPEKMDELTRRFIALKMWCITPHGGALNDIDLNKPIYLKEILQMLEHIESILQLIEEGEINGTNKDS